jgi:urease accessory protein
MQCRLLVSRFGLAALAASLPTLALAHTGVGAAHGFAHGFLHPIGGLDHVLAMVAVGIFAAGLGGRALWAVPLTFMAFMLAGGALGFFAVPVPFVEAGIALSIVALGIAVAVNWNWPVAAAMAMAGLFAVFHGHAHATEMPLDASGSAYALGFLAATGLLHAAGIAAVRATGGVALDRAKRVTQLSGVALAAAGIGMLTGVV